ncbi:MAG: twin-arginine translocation pathway signal protein, partial [Phenylobacterium sp.]
MSRSEHISRSTRRTLLGGLLLAGLAPAGQARAESAAAIAGEARAGLKELYGGNPAAKALGDKAYAVLIFPRIVKAGLVVGGLTGEGAMLTNRGKQLAFYRLSAGSYGLQIGAQKYGYALFFMNEKALDYLKESDGWSVGSGLSMVFVDEGFARTMNSTTLTQDVYAVAFR